MGGPRNRGEKHLLTHPFSPHTPIFVVVFVYFFDYWPKVDSVVNSSQIYKYVLIIAGDDATKSDLM